MQKNSTVQTDEQKKDGRSLMSLLEVGEINTLWKMIDAPTPAATRQRLLRNDPEAIKAAETIISNRKELIENFKKGS